MFANILISNNRSGIYKKKNVKKLLISQHSFYNEVDIIYERG